MDGGSSPTLRQNVEAVKHEYVSLLPQVESFVKSVQALLTSLLVIEAVDVARIEGRAKDIASLVHKYSLHKNYTSLDDVRDMAGIRIVCYYPLDVAKVDQIIAHEFEIIEHQRHGGAASGDAFGYGSLHLIARMTPQRQLLTEYALFDGMIAEIQVRTVLEDAWAIISHKLDYKSAAEIPEGSRRTLYRAAALLETSDTLFDQFRSEVEKAREDYRIEVASTRSGDVALNLESLLEAWQHLGVDQVQEVAVGSGFRDPDEDPYPELLRAQLGSLVDVAAAADLKRLGQIEEIVASIPSHDGALQAIASAAAEYGFVPWGFPADVLSFLIGHYNPQAVGALERATFAPEIVRAIRSLKKSTKET